MQFNQLKRREFITVLGGATAAWPIAARAQQPERMRRIGLLINLAADDPESQARRSAFQRRLAQLGRRGCVAACGGACAANAMATIGFVMLSP
jgi:hypothetical protein